jgi:ketosteroid isomerase-like protein
MEKAELGPVDGVTIAPAEFADAKYSEIEKKGLEAMSKGDMDTWVSLYVDNAKYYWNVGDSLVGKVVIEIFWRNRRANSIATLSFSKDIWLPLKVNEKGNIPLEGYCLLGWYQVSATYKGGGTITQWTHVTYYFDSNDKIDRITQYIDRLLIKEAESKK